jgi:hypothetical protein
MSVRQDFELKSVTLIAVSLLAVLLFAALPGSAQEKAAPAAKGGYCVGCSVDGKTTPRMPDGHPDLNGFWQNPLPANNTRQFERSADGSILFDFGTDFNERKPCNDDSCIDPNEPSYKPEYLAKVKEIAATAYDGSTPLDPYQDCRPLGVPRAGVGAIQFVQTAQVIALLYEGAPYSLYRIIYTDGRPHPKDIDTNFMGDSIGHWEGDTLVVDVTGLNDETWLAGGVANRLKYANIHSDKEHVTERWTRKGDTLTYEATVEDPVMFTKPWVITPRRVQHAGPQVTSDDQLLEQVCDARDKAHFVKPTADDQPTCNYRCDQPGSKK